MKRQFSTDKTPEQLFRRLQHDYPYISVSHDTPETITVRFCLDVVPGTLDAKYCPAFTSPAGTIDRIHSGTNHHYAVNFLDNPEDEQYKHCTALDEYITEYLSAKRYRRLKAWGTPELSRGTRAALTNEHTTFWETLQYTAEHSLESLFEVVRDDLQNEMEYVRRANTTRARELHASNTLLIALTCPQCERVTTHIHRTQSELKYLYCPYCSWTDTRELAESHYHKHWYEP